MRSGERLRHLCCIKFALPDANVLTMTENLEIIRQI